MSNYIGLVPVPPDADMTQFILSELEESKKTTRADNQPYNFTYGKLLRFVQSLSEADRTHLLAISIWEIQEKNEVAQELRDD